MVEIPLSTDKQLTVEEVVVVIGIAVIIMVLMVGVVVEEVVELGPQQPLAELVLRVVTVEAVVNIPHQTKGRVLGVEVEVVTGRTTRLVVQTAELAVLVLKKI